MRHLADSDGLPLLEEGEGSRRKRVFQRTARALSASPQSLLVLHSPPAPLLSRSPVLRLWQWGAPPFLPEAYRPLPPEEAEAVRLQYAEGDEYFLLHPAPEAEMRAALSGFSAFKRRLRSRLRLLIGGGLPPALQKDLSAYRYRGDVRTAPPEALPALTGAAYAVLLPEGGDGGAGLGALHCGIPLLTAGHRILFGDAPLYVEEGEWGPALQRIYSDEGLWSRCAGRGPAAAAPHTFERAAAALREHITFAAKRKKR